MPAGLIEQAAVAIDKVRKLRQEIAGVNMPGPFNGAEGGDLGAGLDELRRLRTLYESDDPLMTPELQQ